MKSIIHIIVPLFFLVFVMVSSNLGNLVNCSLRKYVIRKRYITHLMLLLSILISLTIVKKTIHVK